MKINAPNKGINFYPRPPGGGRHARSMQIVPEMLFLSTPSGGRATALGHGRSLCALKFLSTPSGWRATCMSSRIYSSVYGFLSTPSGWRATLQPPKRPPRKWNFYPRPPGGGRQQKRTKFSSVFAQKGEEFASLRRGKRKICRWRFKKDKFWALIWCEGSGKSVCALASHCG